MLFLEESQAVGAISADAHDFDSGLLQFGEVVAEEAGLFGAAAGEGSGVEEDDDVFSADVVC